MPPEFVVFLDENHHKTPAILQVLIEAGVRFERHADHFLAGTPDVDLLPVIGSHGWCFLTADKRIRYRHLERLQVERHGVRMFCFTSNASAKTLAVALARAIPSMQKIVATFPAPFIATITEGGEVHVRETFASSL